MPIDSEFSPRVCADLLAAAGEAESALSRLAAAPIEGEARNDLANAQGANRRLVTLLETLAELRRPEARPPELALAPHRLRQLIDDAEARWSAPATATGALLTISYDGDPECEALVDAARLNQVLDALVGRALAHAPGGVIEVSLSGRPAGSGVRLACRVRDDGVWIEGADEDPACEDGAVGLGLKLAARQVSAMRGSLEAQPNAGPGGVLSFELDLASPARADEPREEAGRSAHVLVVDDNATNRMVVEALCEMFGCSSEAVADGIEALEAARVGHFDVILMDIKMPRMDGLTATHEIRKLSGPAGRAPIIALTANAGEEEVKTYLAAGMCAVVEKPIKAERLLEALERALEAPIETRRAAAA